MAIRVRHAELARLIKESDKPIIVEFEADWCPPCKAMAPTIEEIASELRGKVVVCKVNVDESTEAAIEYGIVAVPTLVLFIKGRIFDKMEGLARKEEIMEFLRKYVNLNNHLR